jgi:hypothetical protein
MLLAMAVLLIHPQLGPMLSLSAEKAAIDSSSAITASASALEFELPLPTLAAPLEPATEPVPEASLELPLAPTPMLAAITSPAPLAFLKSGKPLTVSVAELQAENRRQLMMWKGLAVASSGAATFDAWSTRRAITNYGAVELNPLLKPFAGNASLYAAIQVAPALLDFAGRKMMYSRHSWVRRAWWVPQSASFVSSIFCGAHNLSYR